MTGRDDTLFTVRRVFGRSIGTGLLVGLLAVALALVITVVAVLTDSPPLVAGITGGVIVLVVSLVLSFRGRANLKTMLEDERPKGGPAT